MKINTEITTKEQAEKLIEKLKNFKEPLQFGRWIKDDGYPKWLGFYDKEKNIHYGITGSGNWIKQECVDNPNNYSRNRYATDQEILDGLSEMALKLGYKKGVRVNADSIFENVEIKHNDFYFSSYILFIDLIPIMHNGNWATIIKQEPTTIESLEKRIADVVVRFCGIEKIKGNGK